MAEIPTCDVHEPWRLRAARLSADSWRTGRWTVEAIRSRAEQGDAASAVDDRAVLLSLLETEAGKASLPVEEMVARLREDNASLRDDVAAQLTECRAQNLQLQQENNELATRLTTAAEVVAPLRSLLVVPPKRREVHHAG